VGALHPHGGAKKFRRNLQGKFVRAPTSRARVNFRTFLEGKVHPRYNPGYAYA